MLQVGCVSLWCNVYYTYYGVCYVQYNSHTFQIKKWNISVNYINKSFDDFMLLNFDPPPKLAYEELKILSASFGLFIENNQTKLYQTGFWIIFLSISMKVRPSIVLVSLPCLHLNTSRWNFSLLLWNSVLLFLYLYTYQKNIQSSIQYYYVYVCFQYSLIKNVKSIWRIIINNDPLYVMKFHLY